ncbi:MAG: DUF2142 domain-containing protein [Anaerolineae bacterium]|nr:DUF2142 domain-containing protein [Anaerolineae bacterium]
MRTSAVAIVILLAFVAFAVAYSFATPIFEASDEYLHFPVIDYIADTGELPVQRPGVDTLWRQEGSQPPLYYLLGAALVGGIDRSDMEARRWINPHAQVGVAAVAHNKNLFVHTAAENPPWQRTTLAVHLVRFFSIALGTLTVALTYAVARCAAPGQPAVALLAMALTAFNPMFLFITGSVNNDNLVIVLAAAGLLLSLRIVRHGLGARRVLLLSVVLALASLSKISGLTLYPLAGLAILIAGVQRHEHKRTARIAGALLVLAAVWAIFAGWWYWRNVQLYGEPLGLDTMVAVAGPRDPLPSYLDLLAEFEGFRITYWGLFGGVNILADTWFYLYADVLTALAAAGLAVWAAVQVRRRQWEALLPAAVVALEIGVVLFGVLNWTRRTLASQGRLMFPVIAGTSLLLALGWVGPAARRWRPLVALGVMLPLLAGALRSPLYIAAAYEPPPTYAALPPDTRPVSVRWGDIELLGYRVHGAGEPRYPGDEIAVTLYWRARAPVEQDYSLYLHLMGRALEEIGKIDTYPGGGVLPTSLWEPGEIIEDTYHLTIDRDAGTPAALRVAVGWWRPPDAGSVLVPVNEAGEPLSGVVLETNTGLVSRDYAEPPSVPETLPAFVGGAFALRGYAASAQTVRAGGAFDVTLYWELLTDVGEDFTIFVHLIDAAGDIRGQGDGPPLYGDYPTSLWLPQQMVIDVHTIAIDAAAPPGEYTLAVGMYRPHDGSRLGVQDADGRPQPDDAFILDLPVTVIHP